MKAEAEAIQKAEEEKARKARDDEERARQRRKKWAAMTMQGYVRSFLARRLLRQRAYKRFAKYFDVASHNYYYEDKRTHVMSWVKPAALGSYDIEMENYWIVMRATTADGTPIMHTVETPVETSVDPENPGSSEEGEKTLREVPLVYYYNPSTWRQTWERPEGTVLCEECNLEFAKRLLNYDQVKYCEFCFAGHAQALVDSGMHPKYVTFKAFQGGSENATRTDFFNTPDDSWFMLILDMNPALKQSEEEEVAAIKRARKRLEARGSTKSAKSAKSSVSASGSVYSPRAGVPKALLELCGICDDKIAVLTCVECATLYCKPCCDMEHSIASHAFHTISTYAPELPEDENGGGENQSALVPHAPLLTPSTGIEAGKKKRRKSHKPDKKSKPKASAALESGPEDTDGADADDEAFLSRPNYGTNYGTDYGTSGGDGGDQGDHDERSRTSGRSPKKDKKSKKEAKKDKKSRWSKDAASDFGDSGTERDGDTSTVGSKKSHHRKKKKDKGDKETTRAFVNSDTEGESTSPNKHKKHKRSKGDPGGTAEESEATGSTHRSKHKKKKASKSKSEDSGPGEESVQSRHHKHKSKHRSKSPADEVDVSDGYATANTAGTDGGSSSKSRSKGHKSKSKHNSKEKNKDKERGKHSRQSGDESGLDTSAFSGLSDTDTGYDTTASSRVKKDKKKKHHKSKSKDKSTDGGGYSGVDSGADTPKKKHKHVKHRAEKFPEKPQDSNREGAGDLGGDLVDAFAGMGVSDAEANYGVSSPEHSERSKSHHKRLKKHKKDTKDKGDESAVSVVSAVDDLDYVAPDSKSPEKKRKKHKTGSADKAVQLGGEKLKPMSAPEQHAHHHKHKKDKKSRSGGGRSDGDDGSFRSSSFKLPDIFQRNGVASAGAGAGGAASEGGEMFGAESGGIFGKKGHKKKKKNHKEHKEKGKEKKKRHSDAETTDQSEPEDRDNKKKAKRHKSEGDRSDPGAESSPSKPHKAYKAHK